MPHTCTTSLGTPDTQACRCCVPLECADCTMWGTCLAHSASLDYERPTTLLEHTKHTQKRCTATEQHWKQNTYKMLYKSLRKRMQGTSITLEPRARLSTSITQVPGFFFFLVFLKCARNTRGTRRASFISPTVETVLLQNKLSHSLWQMLKQVKGKCP